MTFHIIIPVFNRLQHTRHCLDSLVAQDCRDFRVYLVDDGSTDGTARIVTEAYGHLLPLEIIQGDGTLWWGGAIRVGVERAFPNMKPEDMIVTLNNDVVVPTNLLSTAKSLQTAHPNSMLGSISVDSGDGKTISQTGWQMKSWPLAHTHRLWWPATLDDERLRHATTDVDFLPGTATFIPQPIIQKVGTVNSAKLPHYHGDTEYSYRVRKYGFRVLLCRDLVVFHDLLATGVASNVRLKTRLRDVMKSFFTRRSSNCLLFRWRFAVACAPAWAILPFFISDTLKALVRGFGTWLIGPSVDDLKKFFN